MSRYNKMDRSCKTIEKKRTAQDKLISGFNSARYAMTEPIKLRIARARYERLYKNQERNPLVSVYIPTYNRGQLLIERAVSSVLAQTYHNFELVIVGDHCTDNTEKLISEINDSRIRFYNLPKRGYRYPPTAENHWLAGPVVPANKALEIIRGKWIARIDEDDVLTPDHIEALLRFAQKGNYEFVSAQYVAERHGKRAVVGGTKAGGSYFSRRAVDMNNNSPEVGGSQTWLYRGYLKFFKYNINCWRKSWNRANDIDISHRIFNAGVRMGFLDKVVAYVLPRPGEVTIGLEAYRLTAAEKEKYFEFE